MEKGTEMSSFIRNKKGHLVDFDLWRFPDVDYDLDFDVLSTLVTGGSIPSAVTWDDRSHPESVTKALSNGINFQFAAGVALSTWGAAMLVPGPIDAALVYVGFAYGGPLGSVLAVAAYNLFALAVLGTGLFLMWTA